MRTPVLVAGLCVLAHLLPFFVATAPAEQPALRMFCTLAGAPVVGCCEARTTFIAGSLGHAQVTVHAELRGAAVAGIIGAEFYVQGLEDLPGDWVAASSPAVSAGLDGDLVTLSDLDGDGFDDDRLGRITFRSCRSAPLLTLATLTVWSHEAREDLDATTLRVVGGSPPADPGFGCPLLVLCDDPVFTKICVEEASFEINPRAFELPNTPVPADGATGVSPDVRVCWKQQLSPCVENHGPEVHFSTQPNPTWVACELTQDGDSACCDPGSLLPNTTYYWRVLVPATGHSPSPWSFTTGDNVATTQSTWSSVKRLFR